MTSSGRHLAARGPLLAALLILLGGLAWLAADRATDSAPPSGEGGQFARIDAYLQDEIDDNRIPGAALAIVEGDRVVHTRGFGSDGHGNPVNDQTPFWIGSNTKSVTALATMQLVEEGLVDLDDPVQRYLPDFAVADPGASGAITVRHLLNQTSGISRLDGLRVVARPEQDSMSDVVAGMVDLELNRPVGSGFEYANLNSVVLGALIEQVTGQRWKGYVEQSVLDPLGMDHTFADQAAARDAGLTATYRTLFGLPLRTEAEHRDDLVASGYLYSTANDMGRYLAAYLNRGTLDGNRVLSADGVEAMLEAATGPRSFTLQSQEFTAAYGAGWFVGPFASGDDARWHQGSLPHFTAWMVLLPGTDQGVVILLNQGNQFELAGGNAAWSRIPQGVVELMLDEEPPAGQGPAAVFFVLATLVAASAVAQTWHLVRLVRHGLPRGLRSTRAAVPLLWEVGVAAAVLWLYPALLGGLGWSATSWFLPDLTLSVVVLAGLTLATGVVRAVLLLSRRRPVPEAGEAPPRVAAGAPARR